MLINCHSNYSLRYGTMDIKELVKKAKSQHHDCIALTDINCMTGVYDFVIECGKQGIKPVTGIEFRNNDELLYVALAKNAAGFKELNEFLSYRNIHNTNFPKQAPAFDNSYVVYAFYNAPNTLRENEYIGVQTQEINQLFSHRYKSIIKKCVMLHPVTIDSRFEYDLHLCLRAIEHNVILDQLKTHQHGALQHHIPPIDQLLKKYDLFPCIAFNTLSILEACSFEYDFNSVKNKKHYTNSRYEDKELLTQLALKGMNERYGEDHTQAKKRIQEELEIIHKMNFCAHFLITWDITQYSVNQGFYHVGRGSGANSVVAYCIGITHVDPIELNLFFERFLNPHRSSPPDFDIDWSHLKRDQILDYIFDRFGQAHTCFVGAVNTFQNRSPIRELGKVFGLPKEEIDALVKNRRRPKQTAAQASTLSDLLKDEIYQKIEQYCLVMQNKPNQLTMHSCGILITEDPITQYTALTLPPKGYQTAQIDMYTSGSIGLEKLDILSQRGLSSIETCLQTIQKNQGKKVNIHQVHKFKHDQELNLMLSKGNTIGCFYIESPAMRGLLRRLKCDHYITLIAASSIIRPGVAKSGMMREYVLRHNKCKSGPHHHYYPHPIFEEQLKETYGIMVYQEDVIKIAHFFGGLSLADADVLRRAMSGKARDTKQFNQVKTNFINNCKNYGYDMKMVAEVYRQIESFAGFSFCKAHSASYSVESYQSLYLKTHYPLEFIVGVINNFGGFYRTEVYVHEAKMSGGHIHLPCVNTSDYYTNISGSDIHLGFIHVERIDKKIKETIAKERQQNGPYLNLENFIVRTRISYVQLKQLIYLGALRFTQMTKPELLVNARLLVTEGDKKNTDDKTPLLFQYSDGMSNKKYELPKVKRLVLEDAYDEIDVLGFPVSLSTFDLIDYQSPYNPKLGELKLVHANELEQLHEQKVTMMGMLISIKDVPTTKGHMNFGTWIDEKGNYFDTIHFPNVLLKFPFLGAGCYVLYGKVVVDFHFPSIEIIKVKKLAIKADPRYEVPDLQSQLKTTQELKGSKSKRDPYPSENQVNSLYGRDLKLQEGSTQDTSGNDFKYKKQGRYEQPNPLRNKGNNDLPP